MSISQRFFGMIGLGIGMTLAQKEERRPILRKRLLTSCIWFFATLYVWMTKGFSVYRETPKEHIFLSFLYKFEIFKDVVWQNQTWLFSSCAFAFACLVLIISVFINKSSERHVLDIGGFSFFIVTLVFLCAMYAISYDINYFVIGNRCTLGAMCFNFANYAHEFAVVSTAAYILRSTFVSLPDEECRILFCAFTVRKIDTNGVYFVPTAPVPQAFYMFFIFAFDLMPFLYDFYHKPDGRERAVLVTNR